MKITFARDEPDPVPFMTYSRWDYYRDRMRDALGPSLLGIALIIAIIGLIFWGRSDLSWVAGVRYDMVLATAAVLALGALVGASELIARYTDAPGAATRTPAGISYIAVNAVAAGAAFGVVHGFNLLGLQGKDPFALLSTEVVVAGLSAMAIFRASVFTVRVGDTDVPVGPAGILQVIVNAVDRAVDRGRAEPRARLTSILMSGISWDEAAGVLPQFCFDSMQNVSAEERQRLLDWVDQLKTKPGDGEQKTLLLGLRLLNIVGERVLRSTIQGLGTRIREPLKIRPETLAMLRQVDFDPGAPALIAVCYAIALGDTDWRGTVDALAKDIGSQAYDNDVKVLLLASELLKRFGEDTLERALELANGSLKARPAVAAAAAAVVPPAAVFAGAGASASTTTAVVAAVVVPTEPVISASL